MITSDMTIHTRPANRSDANRLTAIARAAKAHWGYPEAWLQAWSEDLQLTPEYLNVHRAYVAELDGEVVGVAVLEDRTNHWQIEHVWVDPVTHRHGVGKRLVNQCLRTARRLDQRQVHVLSDPYAQEFYVRLGAQPIGSVPAPMPDAPERRLPLLAFMADSDGTGSATVGAADTGQLDANKELIQNWIAFADRGFVGDFGEYIHADYLGYLSTGSTVEIVELERLERTFAAAFSDTKRDIKDLIAESDRVVLRVETSTTHTGEFYGLAPTGRHVKFTGMVIYRIEKLRIRESWAEIDFASILRQLRA
jgi:predicted ester cyclase/N-acetylglutamate synthase-like GNAT family acetyltransferase